MDYSAGRCCETQKKPSPRPRLRASDLWQPLMLYPARARCLRFPWPTSPSPAGSSMGWWRGWISWLSQTLWGTDKTAPVTGWALQPFRWWALAGSERLRGIIDLTFLSHHQSLSTCKEFSAEVAIWPLQPSTIHDEWRRWTPSANICFFFFIIFQAWISRFWQIYPVNTAVSREVTVPLRQHLQLNIYITFYCSFHPRPIIHGHARSESAGMWLLVTVWPFLQIVSQ